MQRKPHKVLRMRTKSKNGNVILPKKMIYGKSTATNGVFAFASR